MKHTIFISYGRADAQALALRLEADLRALGHTVWLDRSEIRSGESWEAQIEAGVLGCDVFLALLSPHAVRRPDGVCLDEISFARYNGRRIVPVMIIRCRPPLGIYRLDWVDFLDAGTPGRYDAGFARLVAALDGSDGVEGGYARVFGYLRPVDFGPELARLTREFTGREWLVAKLDDWLRGDERVFLITGDPGTGKSAFMAHLVQRHPAVVAYHFCSASLADSLEPIRFARSIAAQIATQRDGYRSALESVDLEALDLDPNTLFRRLIIDPLAGANGGPTALVVVDALDESLLAHGPTIARVLRDRLEDLPGWLRLVVSSRNEPGVLDLFSRFVPHELVTDQADNRQDVSALVHRKLADPEIVAALARHQAAPDAFALAIAEKANGNFLYATQALAAVSTGQFNPCLLTDFPDGLVGIYYAFFDRQFPGGHGFNAFRPLLDVLCAAREPLSVDRIAAILGRDPFDVAADVERVAAYFPERDGVVRPYHHSVTEWLCGRAGRSRQFRVNELNGHRLVAARLLADWRTAHSDLFVLTHLPAHLAAARWWDELGAVLTELDFIEAKARAGLSSELVADYARADDQPVATLSVWRHFVANHAAELARGECPAFQLAYNSAAGGPVVDAMLARLRLGSGPRGPWVRALVRPEPVSIPACQHKLEGHLGAVVTVAVSSSGKRALSGGIDGTVRVWELETGECRHVLEGHRRDVAALDLTPNGRFGISGAGDHTVRVWDLESGRCRQVLTGHESRVRAVAIAPGLDKAVSGGDDATVRSWDLGTGICQFVLRDHASVVTSVAITADGRMAVSAGMDRLVRVWDLQSARCIHVLNGHISPILTTIISPDGRTAWTADRENCTRAWDLESGRCVEAHVGPPGRLRAVAVTPTGQMVSAAMQESTLLIRDIRAGSSGKELAGHGGPVYAVGVTPDGRCAVSGGADATVRLWDLTSAVSAPIHRSERRQALSVSVSSDGRRVVSSGVAGALHVRDADGRLLHDLVGHENDVLDAVFHPDGSRIVSAGADWLVRVWETDSGRQIRAFAGPDTGWLSGAGQLLPTSHANTVSSVVVTPDGRRAVSSSWDCTLRVWDIDTGDCIYVLRGHTDVVHSLIISPEGRLATSTAYDRVPHVWDLATGQVVTKLVGHTDDVRGLAFTPDGASVLTAGRDRTIRIWDAITGVQKLTLKGHTEPVDAIAVVPYTRQIVSGGWDATVRIWDGVSGAELRTCCGHRGPVDTVIVTKDGGMAVSSGRDGTIRAWDLSKGDQLAVYHSPGGAVSRFVLHGNRVFTATATGWVDALLLENLAVAGPPWVPAVRLWRFERGWDDRLTFSCPACSSRTPVDESDLGKEKLCLADRCAVRVRVAPTSCDHRGRLASV